MHELFAFQLPRPLSSEARQALAQQLGLRVSDNPRRHPSAPAGVTRTAAGIELVVFTDGDEHFRLAARAPVPLAEDGLRQLRARVAHVVGQTGSQDPAVAQALLRQRPPEHGPLRPLGRAASKPRWWQRRSQG